METTDPGATPARARIFLVEDHPIMSHGLSRLIDNQPDLSACGSAESMGEAMPLIQQLMPDVVIVDIALGDENGLDVIKKLHAEYPALRILALSMHEESVYAERALRAGAQGYIMKREAMAKIMTAIRHVLAGEIYISEKMTTQIVKKAISSPTSPMDALTDREFEVFRLLAQGIGPKQVGQKLNLSVKTIETHRMHIKDKLSLKSAAELTRFLSQWALKHL